MTRNIEHVKLSDLLEITSSKRIFASEYVEKGVPFYRSKEIIEKSNSTDISNELFIAQEKYEQIAQKFGVPNENDMLLTSVGTLGIPYLVKPNEKFYFKDGNLTWFRNHTNRISPHYLYHWFKSSDAKRSLDEITIGSTQQALTIQALSSIKIPLLPILEQKAIAKILGTLDDKIELNRQTNKTLEAMARAIFKSWFVHFDPVHAKQSAQRGEKSESKSAALSLSPDILDLFPDSFQDSELGEIPAGWEVGSILTLADLLSGGTPKTSNPEYWNGPIPWASAKDVSQCGKTYLITPERYITDAGLKGSSTKIIDRNSTVIVARGATTGRLVMFGQEMAMNQTCYGLRSKSNTPFYLYHLAKETTDKLLNSAHGSVFDTITTKTFETTKILTAPNAVANEFNNSVASMYEKIHSNQIDSTYLRNTRDTLLPKLISGELRIKDAEKFLQNAPL